MRYTVGDVRRALEDGRIRKARKGLARFLAGLPDNWPMDWCGASDYCSNAGVGPELPSPNEWIEDRDEWIRQMEAAR